MESKKLATLIKKIGSTSKTLRDDIQSALIGCAFHAQINRNTTPFDQLFEAVGDGTRKDGMLKWAMIYAPVHFKAGKVMLSDKRQKECDATEEEITKDLADSEKWYALVPPQPVQNPWDSSKFAETLALYLENAAKKAEKAGDVVMAELVKDAEMLFRVKLNTQYEVKEV